MVLGAAWREKAGKNKAAARSRMKNRRPTFALPAQGNLTARADIPSQCNPSETPRATFQIGLKTEQPLFLFKQRLPASKPNMLICRSKGSRRQTLARHFVAGAVFSNDFGLKMISHLCGVLNQTEFTKARQHLGVRWGNTALGRLPSQAAPRPAAAALQNLAMSRAVRERISWSPLNAAGHPPPKASRVSGTRLEFQHHNAVRRHRVNEFRLDTVNRFGDRDDFFRLLNGIGVIGISGQRQNGAPGCQWPRAVKLDFQGHRICRGVHKFEVDFAGFAVARGAALNGGFGGGGA